MGLEIVSNIIQTKNALTQYVTIPSTMVADSQYPFREAGKVKITVAPGDQLMIISKEDISIIQPKDVQLEETSEGILIKKKAKRT